VLRLTTAVQTDRGEAVTVDDTGIADHLTTGDDSLDLAIAQVSRLAGLAEAPPVDLRDADDRLRRLARDDRGQAAQGSVLEVLSRALARWLESLGATPPDPRILLNVVSGLGLAVILVVVGILGRGLRERVRRDLVLAAAPGENEVDPLTHLHRADDALRAGSFRDAIHWLYLYVLSSLAAREAIRYDPSLTDREILARSRAIPHSDALRDLVALHELVWYGLRDPRAEDAARARSLAGQATL
jgi:hypothetical protein